MKRLFTAGMLLLCLLYAGPLLAQGENNIWCFGQQVGLNFNTTPPALFQQPMKVHEGSASVCDAAGNLLFYSSGSNNWDRNNNLMPNGTGLLGNGPTVGGINTGSSMMGVAILKSPSNPQQYYMITTTAIEEGLSNAYYSVIDMSLNGGLGDVVPGQKNILLATGVDEGITIQETDACGNYWIILHDNTNPQYRAYKVTAAGINTIPVITSGMPFSAARISFNKAGTMAAAGMVDIQLLSFNKATGIFTELGMLHNDFNGGYGTLFSPDGSRLYGGTQLLQYDLSLLPNIAAVQNSKTTIDSTFQVFLRAGPDGKAYTLRYASGYIGCIQNPNAIGTACLYNPSFLPLTFNNIGPYSEMGNVIVIHEPQDTLVQAGHDTVVCQLPQITLNAPSGAANYLWHTGAGGPQLTVSEDGVYRVYSRYACSISEDSFRVKFVRFDTGLGADTILCKGDSLILAVPVAGASYHWQDGSTAPSFTVTGKGRYAVTVTVASCSLSDTIAVDVIAPYINLLENDTTICKGNRLSLHATAQPASTCNWSNGSTGAVTTVDSVGRYIVTASNICGVFSDSVYIDMQYCNCTAYVPNAFSPNGDGRNDQFVIELHCPGIQAYSHAIYNRYGQKVYESKQPGQFWNGMFNGNPCEVGTYFYYLEYKNGEEQLKKKGDLVLVR